MAESNKFELLRFLFSISFLIFLFTFFISLIVLVSKFTFITLSVLTVVVVTLGILTKIFEGGE